LGTPARFDNFNLGFDRWLCTRPPHSAWGAVIAGMFLVSLLDLFFSPRHLLVIGASVQQPILDGNRRSDGNQRVPIMVAPLVGGILNRRSASSGVRVALIISILLAGATFIALRNYGKK